MILFNAAAADDSVVLLRSLHWSMTGTVKQEDVIGSQEMRCAASDLVETWCIRHMYQLLLALLH